MGLTMNSILSIETYTLTFENQNAQPKSRPVMRSYPHVLQDVGASAILNRRETEKLRRSYDVVVDV